MTSRLIFGRAAAAFALAGILFRPGPARADQSNFQIAPPPIPYPYFEPGRKDLKVTGTYVSLSGTGFSFTGVGADGSFRGAFNEKLALDGQFGFNVLGGDLDFGGFKFNPVLLSMNFGGNMEYQFIHQPRGSLLGYIGLVMPFSITTFDKYFTLGGKSITPTSMTTIMFGTPMGLQAGLPLGPNWKLAPFFSLIPYLGGTVLFSYVAPVSIFAPLSADIDPFITTSFGTDIIYVPWNLSIGTMLQQAASSGENEGVRTILIQLTWHWRSS